MKARSALAVLLPFITCYIQWLLWDYIAPFVWFLFFPTAFFSAWLGGIFAGMAATVISALLVWYVFIPPSFSFALENPASAFSIVAFILMGALYVFIFERMRVLMQLTDKQLQVSETRFEATFEQAAVGIALVAPDGHWLRVNNRLCEIIGYSHDELMSKSFQDITYAEDLDADLTFVKKMLAGEINFYAMEKRYLSKDGSIVWINLSVALVRNPDGTPDYFISVVENIQNRRQSEQALRESEERLSGIINSAMDAVISVDEHQRIHLFNPAAALMFGMSATAAIGQPLENLIPERFRNAHAGHIRNFAQKGITARRMGMLGEINGLRANGEEFPIEASISHTLLEGGKLYTVILRDITERHRAENEIRQLNADLERHVDERTAELTAANRELDSFAYAVSHDLRAPLRAMSGFSQALAEDYGSLLQGEAKTYLEQIDLASRKMSDLIDGLLVLSRSTRGELRYDTVDISVLAEQLLAELQQFDPQRTVSVQVEAGLRAQGDTRMIELVLRNLLSNAWKYTGREQAANIRVYAELRDGVTRFCVADNGAGFDMAHANRLFKPFQRLHRQEEFPGIGIGLATVQRIVHRHGGSIEASGEPGKGAVFCFTLASTSGVSLPINREAQ
jgi:PAS domain S-box-containing protein